jgi:hypothetical protein
MSDLVKYPVINGLYRHYKGGTYQVITMAVHTETQEPLVIYKSIMFGSIYARPLSMWFDWVEIDGTDVTRFELAK